MTCEAAAEGGHLDVLRWAREHHCPWDANTCVLHAASKRLAWRALAAITNQNALGARFYDCS